MFSTDKVPFLAALAAGALAGGALPHLAEASACLSSSDAEVSSEEEMAAGQALALLLEPLTGMEESGLVAGLLPPLDSCQLGLGWSGLA